MIECSLFSSCSGCCISTEVTNIPIVKELSSFLESPLEVVFSRATRWRSRAKLAVRKESGLLKIGLFQEGTHRVTALQECPLHYQEMDVALSYVYELFSLGHLEPYDEKKQTGRVRYIQLHRQRSSGKVQLALSFLGGGLEEKERLCLAAAAKKQSLWHSIWSNYTVSPTNTIFSDQWEYLEGEEDFFQDVGSASFCVHPSSFFQANIDVWEKIIEEIRLWITPGAHIVELYAGVGCLGVNLSDLASKVTFVESSPLSQECFQKSTIPSFLREKCFFVLGRVETFSFDGSEEVIVVDPPRKGLSCECKEKIHGSQATELVYVSCGAYSFMRDLDDLERRGWKREKIKSFLLFPGSNQLEIVAYFRRVVV